MISQEFIELFNQAAGLARSGQHQQALAIYESLAKSKLATKDDRVLTGEFLGLVELRRAFCQMDLEKYAEARKTLESEMMQVFISQFDSETMYEYFFCYGNVLGNIGETEMMDDRLSRCLGIAADKLGDLQKCENCWYFIMYWGKQHEQWQFLEDQCVAAHMFGKENASVYLQIKALEFGCYAYRGLGKIERARTGAEVVIERIKQVDSGGKMLDQWKDFLAEINAA